MATKLTDSQVQEKLPTVPDWVLKDGKITRQYQFNDFVQSMSFVQRVALLAEGMDHHPDIDIRWNKVTLRLATHSCQGLSVMDFELARRIDGLNKD